MISSWNNCYPIFTHLGFDIFNEVSDTSFLLLPSRFLTFCSEKEKVGAFIFLVIFIFSLEITFVLGTFTVSAGWYIEDRIRSNVCTYYLCVMYWQRNYYLSSRFISYMLPSVLFTFQIFLLFCLRADFSLYHSLFITFCSFLLLFLVFSITVSNHSFKAKFEENHTSESISSVFPDMQLPIF